MEGRNGMRSTENTQEQHKEHNDIKILLDIYREVCNYSVDQSYMKREELNAPRPSHVDYNEFFNKLYVEREQENVIVDYLNTHSEIILLVGERGSGKTSLIHKIRSKYSENNKYLFLIVDARTADIFPKPLDQIQPEDISEQLMDGLKRKYMDKVFTDQLGKDGYRPVQKLAAYIISDIGRPEGYEFGEITHGIRRKFRKHLEQNGKSAEETYSNMLKWLAEVWDNDDEVYNIIYEGLFKASPFKTSFLMHAAHSVLGYERQYIWVDNVDALSPRQQSRVQSALRRLASSVSEFANVGISVRSENIVIEDEFCEPHAPPNFTTVKLYLHDSSDQYDREAKASLLDEISWEDYNNIVNRRLEFAKVQANIDRELYEIVRLCSNKIVDMFKDIHAVELSNNSIRYLLNQHHNFLRYNIIDLKCEPDDLDKRNLITLFLAWTRSKSVAAHQYDMLLGNNQLSEIKLSEQVGVEERKGLQYNGEYLHYMLLTLIWNLTLQSAASNNGTHKRPTANSIIEVMNNRYSIAEEEIRKAMYALFSNGTREDIPRLIEIINPEAPTNITKSEEIRNDYIVSITSRAKSILRYIMNTYGFVASFIIIDTKTQVINEVGRANKGQYQIPQDEKRAWDKIQDAIEELHRKELDHMISIQNFYPNNGWIKQYLKEYGVPIPKEWYRNIGSIIDKKGSRRATQYEIMLTGIMNYFRDHTIREQIDAKREEYKAELDNLVYINSSSTTSSMNKN